MMIYPADTASRFYRFIQHLALHPVLLLAFAFAFYSTPALAQFTDINANLTGVGDASVAWADYDVDGDLDLIIAGESTNGPVTKLYTNAGGTFTALANTPFIGISLGKVVWGDYDNDNDPDLLLTGQRADGTATTQLYRNDGGKFVDVNAGITALKASMADWGDFDGDGDLDIFIAGVGTDDLTISRIFRNNGNGSFSDSGIQLQGVRRGDGGWIDFNRDGDLDLMLTGRDTQNNRWTLLYKNIEGSFVPTTYNFPFDIDLSTVAWGNQNESNALNLFMAGATGNGLISRLYAPPFGIAEDQDEFQPIDTDLIAVEFAAAAWGDYDNSIDAELVVMGRNPNGIVLTTLYDEVNGSLVDAGADLIGLYKGDLAWGDYDNDGALDLLLAGFDAQDNPVTKIYRNTAGIANTLPDSPLNQWVEHDNTTTTLHWSGALNTTNHPSALTYNIRLGVTPGGSEIIAPQAREDGTLLLPEHGNAGIGNILMLDALSPGTYYWSVQSIDFAYSGSAFTPEQAFQIVTDDGFSDAGLNIPTTDPFAFWGDLDNDGDLDLLTDTDLYENQSGSFTGMQAGVTDAREVADYDNDGDLDILSYNTQNGKIYHNDNGSFFEIATSLGKLYDFSSYVFDSANFGDVDNDGDLDLLTVSTSGSDPEFGAAIVYINANGQFDTPGSEWGVLPHTGTPVIADYDNDGDLDFYISGLDTSVQKTVGSGLHSNTGSAFEITGGIGAGFGSAAAWADYDNDGDLDLANFGVIYGAFDPGINGVRAGVYRNDGGIFTTASEILSAGSFGYTSWADYDNDGDPDLLFTSASQSARLYENRNGTFIHLVGAFDGLVARHAAWGDYDGDDDLDILISITDENGHGATRLFENTRTKRNLAPFVPQSLTSVVNGNAVTLSWIDGTDNDAPADGETYNVRVGTAPGLGDIMTASALLDGTQLVTQLGNVNQNRSWTLHGLDDGVYFWSVQAVDQGYKGSTFATTKSFIVGESPTSGFVDTGIEFPQLDEGTILWGDYSDDGFLDLVASGATSSGPLSSIYYFSQDTLNLIQQLPARDLAAGAWGDLNNDGGIDFVLSGRTAENGHRTDVYFKSNFSSFFSHPLPGLIAGDVDLGDYDNDGDLDILMTGRLENLDNYAGILRNTEGIFTDANAGLTGIRRGEASWVDYDSDGDLDILLTGRINDTITRRTLLYQNDAGTFTEVVDGLPDVDLSSIDWGDYDNDGDPDLLISGTTGNERITRIYRNDSPTVNSALFLNLGLDLPGIEFGAVRWGDYDNDGDLDFVISGATDSGRISEVYENTNGTFNASFAGLIDASKGDIAWGDYDKDGDQDLMIIGQQAEGDRIGKVYQNITSNPNSLPEAPTGLSATVDGDTVTLAWDAGNDAETPAPGLQYNVRIGQFQGAVNIMSPSSLSDGRLRLSQPGNVRQNTSWRITGLRNGQYYWSVQSIDASFAGSPFAAEQTFVITDSQIPVELTTFDGIMESGKVSLTWETASELNNAGFEVQRAVDERAFERIAFVDGNGTTTDAQAYRFRDQSLPFGAEQLHYRLKQIDFDGAFAYSPVVSVEMNSPDAVALLPNYPNPFNPSTQIRYELPVAGDVRLAVYDLTGKEVAVLVDRTEEAGQYQVTFDGGTLASGVYLYRLETGAQVITKRMTLVK